MRTPKSPTGESGFTLLELLVTLTIASLLLTVVGPRLVETVAHARLQASATQIFVALKEVRAAAMKSAMPASLTIEGSRKGYSAAGRLIALPADQTLSLEPYNRPVGAEQSSLQFLPDGTSSGGIITIARGDDHVRVAVDWLTGRVSRSD